MGKHSDGGGNGSENTRNRNARTYAFRAAGIKSYDREEEKPGIVRGQDKDGPYVILVKNGPKLRLKD